MKIAVMGAGAVGCYFGGLLARGGHDVVLIGRLDLVNAVNTHGLRLESKHFDGVVPMRASTKADAVSDADVVLFCVKSQDTASAGALIASHLAPGALVLSMQNGVDNAERLRKVVVNNRVAAVAVYVAVEMPSAGYVKHHGRGDLVLEPTQRSADVAATFSLSDIPTSVSINLRGELWAKLIINCAYNALSAIANVTYGKLVQVLGVTDVMNDVVSECLAVVNADGVDVPGDAPAAVRMIAEAMGGQYSSTAQDIARGKLTEIDYLNGFVVQRGAVLGVPTPVNRTLHTIVKIIEAGQ
ncbi:MAG: ketopantoate reductase family protein [Clostridia bacterium]|nr:ketopantoate reductase family protein [Deltaproteobacteria bacterium]